MPKKKEQTTAVMTADNNLELWEEVTEDDPLRSYKVSIADEYQKSSFPRRIGLDFEYKQRDRQLLFLLMFRKTLLNVSRAAKASGIHFTTYYDWMKNDKEFAQAVESLRGNIYEEMEGRLKDKIILGSERSLHFWLERKHPDFTRKNDNRNLNVNVNKSLEDLLDEDENYEEDQPGDNRGTVQDPQQEERAGEV